jgi:molybdopterin-containing oxidoreductase family iron-sulfur binding subunit
MASNKKYWKSIEELNPESSVVEALKQNEFAQPIPTDQFLGDKDVLERSSTTRRDFLKYVGFSTAAASLAACEGPVIKSIPYVVAPDEIVPGVANYYATTISDGFDFASVLVKTREGRPIKIERNDLGGKIGGVNARVHASVLSMYDKNRLMGPQINGQDATWAELDQAVASGLEGLNGAEVILLTQSFASPSTAALVKAFTKKYPNVKHVTYDMVSVSEALDAFQEVYGMRALADYDFSKAATIVSIGADFLGDWQGGGFEAGYAQSRIPKDGRMSRHIQFEANMSLSGANADKRVPASPAQQAAVLGYITGSKALSDVPEIIRPAAEQAKRQLEKAGSKGVLVCGLPCPMAQKKVLNYNASIGSEVMDVTHPIMKFSGSSTAVQDVIEGVKNGRIKGLITAGVNPLYAFPENGFAEAFKNLGFTLSFAMRADETASAAKLVAATPHYLEAWGDVEAKKGMFSLVQPTIRPLFNTRQFQECMLAWTGSTQSYHDYLKAFWQENILSGSSWSKALHDGVFSSTYSADYGSLPATATPARHFDTGEAMALCLYTKTGLGDGRQANNPWLQELPDPISRATWDNYLTVSAADAKRLSLTNTHVSNGALNGDCVRVTVGDAVLERVPVLIQPGQAPGTVGLALGYGQKASIQAEMQTGVNAYSLYKEFSSVQSVSIEKVAGTHEFACIQLHNTMMGRDIIRETTLEIFNTKDKDYWNAVPKVSKDHKEIPVTSPEADLWDSFDRSIGHHFNLSIDLNACTGCGACVIACHAENNVPVVGKSEMRRSRDMHWLRIDRYYSSEESFSADADKKKRISLV